RKPCRVTDRSSLRCRSCRRTSGACCSSGRRRENVPGFESLSYRLSSVLRTHASACERSMEKEILLNLFPVELALALAEVQRASLWSEKHKVVDHPRHV